jgi:hypothetical protein
MEDVKMEKKKYTLSTEGEKDREIWMTDEECANIGNAVTGLLEAVKFDMEEPLNRIANALEKIADAISIPEVEIKLNCDGLTAVPIIKDTKRMV